MGFIQLLFVLQRRADFPSAVLFKIINDLVVSFGRMTMLPLCAGIFSQGWRLDPILKLGMFLLGMGIIVESAGSVVSDYRRWRRRPGDVNIKSGCLWFLRSLRLSW